MGYITDISEWQNPGNINYDVFAKELTMAIVRTQAGSSHPDEYYNTHITELTKRGVPCGAYAYVKGISLADMQKEAQDFYNRAIGKGPLFWMLDVEEISMQDMRNGVNAFATELRKHTEKKIGCYIASHLYGQLNIDRSKFDFIVIPNYGVNNGLICSTPVYPCDLHQYTSRGKLNGYDRNLDLNRLMNGRTIDFFCGVKPIQPKPQSVQAPQNGIVIADLLNVRENAGVNYKAIGTLKKGETVKIAKKVNDFYSIYFGDHGGYVSSNYVSVTGQAPAIKPVPKSGTVIATELNVRKGPGMNFVILGKLEKGESVKIAGMSGNWYSIYYKDHGGYVSADYIK